MVSKLRRVAGSPGECRKKSETDYVCREIFFADGFKYSWFQMLLIKRFQQALLATDGQRLGYASRMYVARRRVWSVCPCSYRRRLAWFPHESSWRFTFISQPIGYLYLGPTGRVDWTLTRPTDHCSWPCDWLDWLHAWLQANQRHFCRDMGPRPNKKQTGN